MCGAGVEHPGIDLWVHVSDCTRYVNERRFPSGRLIEGTAAREFEAAQSQAGHLQGWRLLDPVLDPGGDPDALFVGNARSLVGNGPAVVVIAGHDVHMNVRNLVTRPDAVVLVDRQAVRLEGPGHGQRRAPRIPHDRRRLLVREVKQRRRVALADNQQPPQVLASRRDEGQREIGFQHDSATNATLGFVASDVVTEGTALAAGLRQLEIVHS